MTRRQLRVITSSDEEEEPPPPPPQQLDEEDEEIYIDAAESHRSTFNFENVSLNSSNPNPNPNPPEPHAPLDISDDEFIDVSDNFSPPPPPPSASTTSAESTSFSGEVSHCPVERFLSGLGLRLRREWLDSCIRGLENAVPGFGHLDSATKAKLCLEQFMRSDMNCIGAGVLPPDVSKMHLVDLVGPFVLQVDEIVNISRPLKGRYQNAASGLKRCLKLSMTDGVQRVFGMEYRPIKNLEVLGPAGLKIVVCNITVRHGILMLVPEVLEVLGGLVEELDAARERLVVEVNKPARGNRTRTGEVLPLASRATIVAWLPNGVNAPGQTPNSVSQVGTPFQADGQGDRETPFNYLAGLSAKWAAMKGQTPNVQGKIKCFLTGVKGFQYRGRTTYDLHVYVDDGSLISEILIDHKVVQKGIGYSPDEVTAALVSSDMKRVSDMKETLRQFQVFLVNFEGIMVVQISDASPVPLAIEMNQGCAVSDAWDLLRRLQPSRSAQRHRHSNLEPINLSPD